MEYYVELKLREDGHNGGFCNGLTLCGSQSTMEIKRISEDETGLIFEDDRKHRVTLHTTKRGDATEFTTSFENNSDRTETLELLSSFAIRGIKADKIYRMQSFWSAEGKLRVDTSADLQLEPSWNRCGMRVEKFGNLGSMPVRKWFPFIALENSETNEFLAVQLYQASSWQIELLCRGDETLTLTGGIADRDFGHWSKNIAPGETFTTPRAVMVTGTSLYDVCDKLVKAQHPNISPVDEDCGIIFNEYCTTWGNPSLENLKKIADKLKGRGVKYLVMDSGWYGNDKWWWECVGDWDINYEKFPGGLKPLADYIRQCGMIPGIWYEFESLGSKSKYYNAEEHLLKKDGVVITVGGKRFWDMADPWVIDYLSEKVIKLLKDSGFGYLKVDYNDTIGIGCDGAESLGEGLRQRVLASQAFFQKIADSIPGIVIENCSSGGHRLEPSMMEVCSQASFSDAHEINSIPIIAANVQRVIPPSQSQIWAVMRATDSKERIYYSIVNTFLGRMCLSGDIYKLSEEQWAQIEEGMAFYKEAADVIKNGKTIYYANEVISYNRPTGNQLVIRELGKTRLIIAHRYENSTETNLDFLQGCEIIREYGSLNQDFTAKAWLVRMK